jgi:hypothetical protein
LGLETALDSVDRAAGAARLARHEEDAVLLREERVRALARLARDVLDDVPAEDVLDLLLLEAALDDEARGAVDGAGRAHLREHELDDVLGLSVHALADVADVREDRLLVALARE